MIDNDFLPYMGQFDEDIRKFNKMYNMPKVDGFDPQRLPKFVDIIKEEVEEHGCITDTAELADWLGDIIVYCASEMVRCGLDPSVILSIIMDSNESKMGPDGKPIYDERGKLLKGPNYWAPEGMIQLYLDYKRHNLYGKSNDQIGNIDEVTTSKQEVTSTGTISTEAIKSRR